MATSLNRTNSGVIHVTLKRIPQSYGCHLRIVDARIDDGTLRGAPMANDSSRAQLCLSFFSLAGARAIVRTFRGRQRTKPNRRQLSISCGRKFIRQMAYSFEDLIEAEDALLESEQLLESLNRDANNTPTELPSKESIALLRKRLHPWQKIPCFEGVTQEVDALGAQTECKEEDRSERQFAVGNTMEPSVRFAPKDRVGLSFSGGGIRSATFNLGLLQGLDGLGVLRHIDYVSSVSGGGYISAWWTAWRTRQKQQDAPISDLRSGVDQVRHLRRFSNFLVPRIGFFRIEFWNSVMAWLCGFIPSFAVATTVLLAAVWAWLTTAWLLLGVNPIASRIVGVLLVFSMLVLAEIWWQLQQEGPLWPQVRYLVVAGLSSAIVFLLSWQQFNQNLPPALRLDNNRLRTDFWSSIVVRPLPEILSPGLILLIAVVSLIAARFIGYGVRQLLIKNSSISVPTGDWELALRRVLDRLVAASSLWLAFGAIWIVGLFLNANLVAILTGSGAGAVSFAFLQRWFTQALRPAKQAGVAKKVMPVLPQLLAYTVVLLALMALSIVIQRSLARGDPIWAWLCGCAAILAIAYCLYDPINIGLHAFYRDRLCRAYLGASNRPSDLGLKAEPQAGDDVNLCCTRLRPLHLICCAANELDADPLVNLSRGARSAVLSRIGVSVSNSWSICPNLTLSSAITASASAFNPGMGRVSMDLGPAVAFLMCLGSSTWLVGSASECEAKKAPTAWKALFQGNVRASDNDAVHLSDGGHFENLGLYELVRRHCRYIIASDCAADPTVAFDDLANAMRLVREDFGVEIEIDVSPLRPDATGIAQQHVVVGTIHYDHRRPEDNDKGILLYIKPSLTGDEPGDIQQYNARNKTFPNESTADQFYDEAQWESYRRLGEHAARSSLRFLQHLDVTKLPTARIFTSARWEWYPNPLGHEEQFIELTARFTRLEEQIGKGPRSFHAELYPEFQRITAEDVPELSDEERQSAISLLVQMLQLMEDVYVGCRLEETWSHPLKAGWMNLFARWTHGRSFRQWWPILQGLYSRRFRDFIRERFGIREPTNFTIVGPTETLPPGLAATWWTLEQKPTGEEPGFEFYEYLLKANSSEVKPLDLQIALARIAHTSADGVTTARWTTYAFYVPPSLWGTGIGTRFLQSLLVQLRGSGVSSCEVTIPEVDAVAQRGNRAYHTDTITFYKSAGFAELPHGTLTLIM